MTYQILNRDGVFNIREIAKEYYAQQTHLDEIEQWTHDRYLKQSSHARAMVRAPSADEFKDCSVWSINHYLGLNRHPYVIEKAKEATELYGTGCGTSAMSGGTGLGLAYCKRTMQALDGEIYCESKLGKYTAFRLSFPDVALRESA